MLGVHACTHHGVRCVARTARERVVAVGLRRQLLAVVPQALNNQTASLNRAAHAMLDPQAAPTHEFTISPPTNHGPARAPESRRLSRRRISQLASGPWRHFCRHGRPVRRR